MNSTFHPKSSSSISDITEQLVFEFNTPNHTSKKMLRIKQISDQLVAHQSMHYKNRTSKKPKTSDLHRTLAAVEKEKSALENKNLKLSKENKALKSCLGKAHNNIASL